MGMVIINRFDVLLISLDPTQGYEINKTRPCLVISPNEINHFLKTIIVAPMTTKGRDYPTRIGINFLEREGQVVLDQIRTIDKSRIVKKLGTISELESKAVLDTLQHMFIE
jgi:mRNA interferase MazF